MGKGADTARPVAGDPGISSHMVLDHVFTLVTGTLRVTIEGQPPVDVGAGDSRSLKGGVMHTFTNIGKVPATIVEVFGKAPAAPGR